MPRKPQGEPPSPDHYWHNGKGAWKLRRGVRKIDLAAEAERLAILKEEARLRPKRAPKNPGKPANPLHQQTMTQTIEAVERVLNGEYLPKARPETPAPPPPVDYQESVTRLEALGLDEYLALLEEGHSERELCKRLGTRPRHLKRWLTSTPGTEQRVREARKAAAQAWLDRGLAVLQEAESLQDLAKAREISMICRKYAAILDSAYSDKVQVDTTVRVADPAVIDQRLALLVRQVAGKRLPTGPEGDEVQQHDN